MRNTLILLLALFAGTAFAQAPVIDSMLIDESKGILSVYGDFGSAQGKVWCDSVELPVLSWSASLVTATIPDTGKGSAGAVVVTNVDGESKSKLISKWAIDIRDSYFEQHSWQNKYYNVRTHVMFRFDLDSRSKTNVVYTIMLMGGSYYQKHYVDGTRFDPQISATNVIRECNALIYLQDSLPYSEGFLGQVRFDNGNTDLEVTITNINGIKIRSIYEKDLRVVDTLTDFNGQDFWHYLYLDDEFGVSTVYDSSNTQGNYSVLDINGTSSFLPPSKIIILRYNPSIITPKNNGENLGTDDILLKWDSLKYMDGYHIQLSKDSLINGQHSGQAQQGFTYIIDTIVSSLDFALPQLEKNTKYYWRVCGVNTEGESRWSEVWSFTTGTSTDVKAEAVRKELRIYPNPATSELTILTSEPTRLLLYDVTGKIVKSEQVTSHETKWDVSLLPNGTYILGTSGGQMQVVQIVK